MVMAFLPSFAGADASAPGLSYSAFEEALNSVSGWPLSVRVFLSTLMQLQCGDKDDLLQNRSQKSLKTFSIIGDMCTVVMLLLGSYPKGEGTMMSSKTTGRIQNLDVLLLGLQFRPACVQFFFASAAVVVFLSTHALMEHTRGSVNNKKAHADGHVAFGHRYNLTANFVVRLGTASGTGRTISKATSEQMFEQ